MSINQHRIESTDRNRQLRGRLSRFLCNERGETLVTTVMALPLLFIFIFGLMQVCVAYYTYEEISEMAREGCRQATVRGSTCMTSDGASCTYTATDIQNFVKAIKYPNLGGGTIGVTASWPNPDGDTIANAPGNPVKVVVTYTLPYKIPFLTTTPISLSSTSEMTILL